MTLLEGLRAVRELLAVPERWTKGEAARTASGHPSCIRASETASWCVEGAIMFVANKDYALLRMLCTYLNNVAGMIANRFNDAPNTTHSMMLAMLDRAIAMAEDA